MAQDIDLSLLPDLTPGDLADAGVASIGHRRRILTAASALRPPAAPAPVSAPVTAPLPTLSERRIVTAMFCDLVGSTRLSTELDPEEYRDLITAFRALVGATLAPYQGHVARFLGDGIVVFFGLSRIEEHTAENAVAAALEIVAQMGGITAGTGQPAQVRLGIATGMTLVDAPRGAQGALDDPVVGEIPNLAARLQAEAAPGAILVSQATRDRLGHLFHCEDAGILMLKGVAGGLRAWRILSHADAASRFDALRGRAPGAGFIGRTAELARLARQSMLARTGQGCMSLITGEPGMGKSRLAREGLARAGSAPAQVPVLQCTPYHAGTPFHPLRRLFIRTLGTGDDGSDMNNAVSTFLAKHGFAHARATTLLLDVLSDQVAAPAGARDATERRAEVLAFLTDLLLAMAQKSGAVLLEDVQWLDPSTAELLKCAGSRLSGLGGHLIVTMRPGPIPDWCVAMGADILPLDRLGDADFSNLIRTIARATAPQLAISDAQVTEIAARCDGSPVFAEELTRYMLEANADGRRAEDQPLPATLADSLLARLDRLQSGRLLAQQAAVIGNEFPLAILIAVSDLPEAEARRGIEGLMQAGVLQVGHSAFGPAVGFRHMLLQEAAYMTLLRRDRQALHTRIANVLIQEFADVADAVPQVVAHQLSRGGVPTQAAIYWDRAGTKAARRSAYTEAVGHFRRALEDIVRAVPDADQPDPAIEQTELAVRLNLVAALVAAEGFNAPAVREEMPRAEALGAALQSREQLLPLLVSKWVFLGASGQLAASVDVARQISDLAIGGTEVEALLAMRTMGTSLLFRGEFDAALTSMHSFFGLYDPDRHDAGLNAYGTSNHAAMMALGIVEIAVLRDDPVTTAQWATRVEVLSDASGQAHDRCNTTMFLGCILPALRADFDTVETMANRLRQIAETHGLAMWAGYADVFLGTTNILAGRVDAGMDLAERGIEQIVGAAPFLSVVLMFYVESCVQAGRVAPARASFDRIGKQHLTEDNWLNAEMRRIGAVLCAAEGMAPDNVRSLLTKARAIATRQGAALLLRKITRTEEQLLQVGLQAPV